MRKKALVLVGILLGKLENIKYMFLRSHPRGTSPHQIKLNCMAFVIPQLSSSTLSL